jgi:hypothetical protein
VRACGSAPETVSCCACVAPAFDDIACADSGTPTISYLGCTYVGGVDRYVVGKRDSARNLCFNLVLSDPGTTKAGLTLPSRLGLESASVGPAATCPARTRGSVVASQVTGTVTGSPGTGGLPTSFGVDVTLTFPADAAAPMTERLVVDAVDLQAPCKN